VNTHGPTANSTPCSPRGKSATPSPSVHCVQHRYQSTKGVAAASRARMFGSALGGGESRSGRFISSAPSFSATVGKLCQPDRHVSRVACIYDTGRVVQLCVDICRNRIATRHGSESPQPLGGMRTLMLAARLFLIRLPELLRDVHKRI